MILHSIWQTPDTIICAAVVAGDLVRIWPHYTIELACSTEAPEEAPEDPAAGVDTLPDMRCC